MKGNEQIDYVHISEDGRVITVERKDGKPPIVLSIVEKKGSARLRWYATLSGNKVKLYVPVDERQHGKGSCSLNPSARSGCDLHCFIYNRVKGELVLQKV